MAIFDWFGGQAGDRPPTLTHTFACKLNCNGCCNAVRKAVDGQPGVKRVHCSVDNQQVVIEGWLSEKEAEEHMKKAGKEFKLMTE